MSSLLLFIIYSFPTLSSFVPRFVAVATWVLVALPLSSTFVFTFTLSAWRFSFAFFIGLSVVVSVTVLSVASAASAVSFLSPPFQNCGYQLLDLKMRVTLETLVGKEFDHFVES